MDGLALSNSLRLDFFVRHYRELRNELDLCMGRSCFIAEFWFHIYNEGSMSSMNGMGVCVCDLPLWLQSIAFGAVQPGADVPALGASTFSCFSFSSSLPTGVLQVLPWGPAVCQMPFPQLLRDPGCTGVSLWQQLLPSIIGPSICSLHTYVTPYSPPSTAWATLSITRMLFEPEPGNCSASWSQAFGNQSLIGNQDGSHPLLDWLKGVSGHLQCGLWHSLFVEAQRIVFCVRIQNLHCNYKL